MYYKRRRIPAGRGNVGSSTASVLQKFKEKENPAVYVICARSIPAEEWRTSFKMHKNAQGSASNAQRERFDTHDPGRGFVGELRTAKKRTATAFPHARSAEGSTATL